MATVGNIDVNLRANTAAFDRKMRNSARSVQRFNRDVRVIQRAMTGLFGTGMAIGGAYMLTRSLREISREAATFEHQMAKVSTMLDSQSMSILPRYRDQILDMSIAFGEGTTALTEGMYQILSATIGPKRAMDVLATSAKSAKAGFTETGISANLITTILKSYSLEAIYAGAVSDKLFSTIKRGKTVLEELNANMGKVAALAATAGVSLDDFLAAISTLTRAGMPTEIALTSIRAILSTFLKPDPKAKKLAWEEFGLALNTATLRGLRLVGVLDKLRNASAEQIAIIMPERRALAGLAAALRNADSAAVDLDLHINSAGQTQEAFAKMTGTTAFQMGRYRSSIAAVKTELGEGLLPALGSAAEGMAIFARDNRAAIRRWASDTVEGIQIVIDAWKMLSPLGIITSQLGKINLKSVAPLSTTHRKYAIEEYRQMTGDMEAFTRKLMPTGGEAEVAPKYMQKWQQIRQRYIDQELSRIDELKKRAAELGTGEIAPTGEILAPPAAGGAAGILGEDAQQTVQHVMDIDTAYRRMFSELNRKSEQTYNLRRQLLKKEKAEYLKATQDKLLVEEWFTEQSALLNIERMRTQGNFFEGFAAGAETLEREMKTWGETGYDVATGMADAFSQGITQMIMDARSFADVLRNLGRMIAEIIIMQQVAMPIASAIGGAISGAVGGLFGAAGSAGRGSTVMSGYAGGPLPYGAVVAHRGGRIGSLTPKTIKGPDLWANAPRLHGGLAHDEYRAILQRGETVKRAGAAAGGALHVEVNLHNESGVPLKATQGPIEMNEKEIIVGVFLEDMRTYGPMRQAMEGAI